MSNENKVSYKELRNLIKSGKLYFDFSANKEEDMKDYIENGYKWKDEYSYYKISEIVSKYDHELFRTRALDRRYHNCYILEEEDGCVDYFLFRIKDVKRIDENHFEVADIDNKENVFRLAVR